MACIRFFRHASACSLVCLLLTLCFGVGHTFLISIFVTRSLDEFALMTAQFGAVYAAAPLEVRWGAGGEITANTNPAARSGDWPRWPACGAGWKSPWPPRQVNYLRSGVYGDWEQLNRPPSDSATRCQSATGSWRRGSESNRRIGLLQSPALPLGYPARTVTRTLS
jgi:hypothetical protein